MEELSGGAPVTPQPHGGGAGVAGGRELPDHRGDHVTRLEVGVVTRPVEIGGEQVDEVAAVLLAVGLCLHQEHAFRKAVRRVGLLRVARPDVGLAERQGHDPRVRADRAGDDDLGHALHPARFEQLDPHERVLVEEPPRLGLIRADPTDDRSKMDHGVGPERAKHCGDLRAFAQVVVRAPDRDDVRTSPARCRATCDPRKPVPPVTTTRAPSRTTIVSRRGAG